MADALSFIVSSLQHAVAFLLVARILRHQHL